MPKKAKKKTTKKTQKRTRPSPAQRRADACSLEIAATLEKYNCHLVATPAFIPDGIGGFRIVIGTITTDALPEE